jgi:beta-glucosidase
MIAYTDNQGNTYDFGFGLNWKGQIRDSRTVTYVNTISRPVVTKKDGKIYITCSTAGASIYYSINDSIPAFRPSNLYHMPFPAKKGQTVKAIAKKSGINNSGIVIYKTE